MGFSINKNTELNDPHMNRESREEGDLFQLLERSKKVIDQERPSDFITPVSGNQLSPEYSFEKDYGTMDSLSERIANIYWLL